MSVSLPIPPLSGLLPWRTGGFLSGWVEASLGATLHGDCFTADQELISLSCAQTELKGCQPNVNTMLSTQCCQPNV